MEMARAVSDMYSRQLFSDYHGITNRRIEVDNGNLKDVEALAVCSHPFSRLRRKKHHVAFSNALDDLLRTVGYPVLDPFPDLQPTPKTIFLAALYKTVTCSQRCYNPLTLLLTRLNGFLSPLATLRPNQDPFILCAAFDVLRCLVTVLAYAVHLSKRRSFSTRTGVILNHTEIQCQLLLLEHRVDDLRQVPSARGPFIEEPRQLIHQTDTRLEFIWRQALVVYHRQTKLDPLRKAVVSSQIDDLIEEWDYSMKGNRGPTFGSLIEVLEHKIPHCSEPITLAAHSLLQSTNNLSTSKRIILMLWEHISQTLALGWQEGSDEISPTILPIAVEILCQFITVIGSAHEALTRRRIVIALVTSARTIPDQVRVGVGVFRWLSSSLLLRLLTLKMVTQIHSQGNSGSFEISKQ